MSNFVPQSDETPTGLRLTQSNLEAAFAEKPELRLYVDRLKALDVNHNQMLELDEGKGNEEQDQI